MKRKIKVRTAAITITAVIDTKHYALGRNEVEALREDLADRLMRTLHEVRYVSEPLCRIEVSK